ncbi:DegT/DnrJ/EryC1/StrS family aminotransferase [Paenibacillus sp. OAS669]|uniref:DegT/DnrJ/EryC1/StrS family aminotransferase n=1 Tax=Paenibacillus sp. OAS669 TaxID=2663821 RepID=UPI0017895B5C|nr:DegT/DnrJ/EryC1/StrS aminotransferase family protein [Paenibacillus sp. OAS669]MBE1445668.1 perosamine synthetase [Paenibacillus sp. OAS669]
MIAIAKPVIDELEIQAVVNVMRSGNLAQGDVVFDFENQFSNHFGNKYSAAISNGTVALHIALLAAGVTPGDVVLTTPFSFIATTNAIIYCGAIPHFVDVDDKTFNISPQAIEEALIKNRNIKYLLLVHLYGQACKMDDIMEIARKYDVKVIEDCAQAHGSAYNKKPVGTFGIGGTFSFYPTKNMTTGEGGMIVSENEDYISYCKKLINHGSTVRYVHDVTGYNYRMTNISAAIGLAQLTRINKMNELRQENANYFLKHIENEHIILPYTEVGSEHIYHQFTLKTNYRESLIKFLTEKEIGYGIHYPVPINEQKNVIEYLDFNKSELQSTPVAKTLSEKVISIPVHPSLSKDNLEYIVETVNEFKP